MSTSSALSKQDSQQLRMCEDVISRGLETFYEVGQALTTIRDARLYRQDFESFEAYVGDKWGISRPRAYELISAVQVQDRLSAIAATPIRNEAQARALSRAPEDRQCEAWEEANARTNGRPTAKAITAVVKRMTATTGATRSGGNVSGNYPRGCDSMRSSINYDAPEIHTGRPLPVRAETPREDVLEAVVEAQEAAPVSLVQMHDAEPVAGTVASAAVDKIESLLDQLEDQDFTAGGMFDRQSWARRLVALRQRASDGIEQ